MVNKQFFIKLKELDLEVLYFFNSQPFFKNGNYTKLLADSNDSHFRYSQISDSSYSFSSFLDCQDENRKNIRIYFGVNAQSENTIDISYFMAIKDIGIDEIIYRKFHFDTVEDNTAGKSNKPIFHLQYGGKICPSMVNDGITDEHCTNLYSGISKPRLFYTPMSLCMLANIIFNEYNSNEINKLVQSSYWRNLVEKNEEFIFNQYIRVVDKILNTKGLLLSTDFYYSK